MSLPSGVKKDFLLFVLICLANVPVSPVRGNYVVNRLQINNGKYCTLFKHKEIVTMNAIYGLVFNRKLVDVEKLFPNKLLKIKNYN